MLIRIFARVLLCFFEDEMILLHGFIKKTRKTPTKELDIALKRKGNLMKKNPHIGSSLDHLFEEEGTLEEINLIATKRVIAWQISEAMNKKN